MAETSGPHVESVIETFIENYWRHEEGYTAAESEPSEADSAMLSPACSDLPSLTSRSESLESGSRSVSQSASWASSLASSRSQFSMTFYNSDHCSAGLHGNTTPAPEDARTTQWPPVSSCILNYNYVMGETECDLTVLDVADSLQDQYAYISGGCSSDRSPIITFPDRPGVSVTDHQYRNLVRYLTNIPQLTETELGFVLVVDRRKDKWGAVKTILLNIDAYFPATVNEVYVLRPCGFMQRTISDVGFRFSKSTYRFPVIMLSSETELHAHLPADQLTEELGGTLQHDPQEWINHRAAIEKFTSNTVQVGLSLRNLCRRLQDTEYPNDVTSTEYLIQTQQTEVGRAQDDCQSVVQHGQLLVDCFHAVRGADGTERILSGEQLAPSRLSHVTCVERLLVQLEETDKNFSHFWEQHERRLQQCLQLRRFEEDFKQVHLAIEEHLRTLESLPDPGDSLPAVEELRAGMRRLEGEARDDVTQAEALQASGQEFIDNDHYAVDCIRPKCIELQRVVQQYREVVRRRNELLQKSHDLHDRIDKANKWCQRGMDLLTSQEADQQQTPGDLQAAVKDVENFMDTAAELQLSNPREFREQFESITSPQNNAAVSDVLRRLEDVQGMCLRRRDSLQRRAAQQAARQAVTSQPPRDRPRDRRQRRGSGWAAGRRSQSADRVRGRIAVVRHDESDSSSASLDNEASDVLNNSMATEYAPAHCSPPELEILQSKKRHVMKELIETERVYVRELKDIIEGYHDEVDAEEHTASVPTQLRQNKHVLFGNLDDLYRFHSNVFLKDLVNCSDTPALVGKCFVDRKEDFQLYGTYCQNKPASDTLRKEIGDHHEFLKGCQRRLGHRLPLDAYLLKPVQRVTKYQLLLKEMLKYSAQQDDGVPALREALATMLRLLKYVNDVMHQVAITGYTGDLSTHGKLLMQGSFNVWVAHKNRIKDLRFKPMQRHVFLYENVVLFCKHKEDPLSPSKSSYIYKNSLKTADIGLTENVKGDKRKLELWVRGRTEIYSLQAPSGDEKSCWVAEIKRVLMSQFDQIKVRRQSEQANLIRPSLTESESSPQLIDHSVNNNAPPVKVTLRPAHHVTRAADDQQVLPSRHDESYESDGGWSTDEWDDDSDVTRTTRSVTSDPADLTALSPLTQGVTLQYVCLADYNRVDPAEMSMREGDVVLLLRQGFEGWWFVRLQASGEEGWVPASYLESMDINKRRSSHSTLSFSSGESSGIGSMRGTADSHKSVSSAAGGQSPGTLPYNPMEETLV